MRAARWSVFATVLTIAVPGRPLAQALFDARLSGFQEVPSISTSGSGTFVATVSGSGGNLHIDYELSYRGLSAPATVAHIHFGQRAVAAGISAFLCGGGNKPACPGEGTVTGTIRAADVIGPENRGIAAGEIGELVRAMRAGFTYANVHSTQYPDGEIRGQISEDVESEGP